jgi:drug/metabolite transporter (DMT)-like permease
LVFISPDFCHQNPLFLLSPFHFSLNSAFYLWSRSAPGDCNPSARFVKIGDMKNNHLFYPTILALTTAVISGTNNFLTKIAVTAVKDPIVFTALKNAIVALFLIGVILALKKRREIKSLNKGQFLKLLAIGVIGGSLPFALFFSGLAQTSAINASLIHKTLFIWVLLLAIPLLKERLTKWQWLGVAAIFGANLLVGGFKGFRYNAGELMILGATLLWAVENIIAKIALRDLSSTLVAGARMAIGSLILLAFVVWRGGGGAVYALNFQQWSWALLTSILLLSYVLTWYTALKHAPATYVATLLVPATLVTNVLSAVFVSRSFSGLQVASSILFVAGAAAMIVFAKNLTCGLASNPSNEKSLFQCS